MYSLLVRLLEARPLLTLPLSLAISAIVTSPSAAKAFAPAPKALVHHTPPSHTAINSDARSIKVDKPKVIFNANKASVYAGELSIAGVTLYSTKEDVLWMLGTPKSQETLPGSFIDEILYFGGISISFAGNQVWDIVSTSPKYCTPSGICPGDPVSYVFDTLGPTDIVGQNAVYTAGGCRMDLGIAYDAVSQIKLVCQ